MMLSELRRLVERKYQNKQLLHYSLRLVDWYKWWARSANSTRQGS